MKNSIVIVMLLTVLALSSYAEGLPAATGYISHNSLRVSRSYSLVIQKVTCVFDNAQSVQKCMSIQGSCQGTGSCTATITGKQGRQVAFQSTCGDNAQVTVDGKDKTVVFRCSPPKASAPAKVRVDARGSGGACSAGSECAVVFSHCTCSWSCLPKSAAPRKDCARFCAGEGQVPEPGCACSGGKCAIGEFTPGIYRLDVGNPFILNANMRG